MKCTASTQRSDRPPSPLAAALVPLCTIACRVNLVSSRAAFTLTAPTRLCSQLERPVRGAPHQPPALFTLDGERVESTSALVHLFKSRGGLLLLEGGQWVWPAPSIGFTHHVSVDDLTMELTVLSERPRVLQVRMRRAVV